MAKTLYLVLEDKSYPEAGGDWSEYAFNIEATSASGAIRAALNGKGDLGTRYVAVPQRSWNPQSVEVETNYRLKIG